MAATVDDIAARVLRRLGIVAVDEAERPATVATVPAAEIALRALQWIGVVAADETPAAADTAAALAKVRAVSEGQIAAGNASWTADAVPLSVSEDYVMLTAMHLAPMFGRTADPKAVPVLEGRIKRAAMVARAMPQAAQAVMDVHSSLDARGMARWSVFDIPDYAEGPYAVLASNLLAPQFGMQPDPLAGAVAMRELAETTALTTSGETMRPDYF